MAESSDAIIKKEIIETLGYKIGDLRLRIFPQSSRDDQILFEDGGLTFSFNGVSYGSCDACWYFDDNGVKKPIVALEGTDALNRGSSGNAQYQRFHHALGAVRNGLVGIYYLKGGIDKIQEDLFGMAYFASRIESGEYLIFDDLDELGTLLNLYGNKADFDAFIEEKLQEMYQTFRTKFDDRYEGDWNKFADKRSTIIKDDYVIKFAGRGRRNFTDSSQRAGHIAVGEMYLTKYYFYDKYFYYLFPKMTREDMLSLDKSKATDKEWFLLRNEPNVEIKTMDDIEGLSQAVKNRLISIKDLPINKGEPRRIYNECAKIICDGLKNNTMSVV
jgi:hypothetical protein